MKKLLNISLLLSFLAVTATNLQAQKFGYLNSGSILAAMPGVEDSDQALKVYQDSLVTIGEEKAAALKTEFEAFAVEYQGGNVPPIKAQQKQEEFQKREQELVQYEQVIYNLVNDSFQFVPKLTPFSRKAYDWFGFSIDADSNQLLVGAPSRRQIDPFTNLPMIDAGGVFLFRKDSNGIWKYRQEMIANDISISDKYGTTVALGNGSLLVGAVGEDYLNIPDAGSVYLHFSGLVSRSCPTYSCAHL